MRVMSFNVLCGGMGKKEWRHRRELVLNRIREINPDTFGVQEAHIDWMKCLCKGLPEYSFVGVGRDDGAKKGEFSPVFYKTALYEPVDSGNFWLSDTPDVPSKGWDGVCIRICSWVILREKATGKLFAQFNTHLDHRGEIARVEGIKLVKKKMLEFDMPVICTGDFNTDESSEPYTIMVSDIMVDAKYVAESSCTGNTFNDFDPERTKNDSPIDFIFVKASNVKVLTYTIMNKPLPKGQPSDHYAIYSDMELLYN